MPAIEFDPSQLNQFRGDYQHYYNMARFDYKAQLDQVRALGHEAFGDEDVSLSFHAEAALRIEQIASGLTEAQIVMDALTVHSILQAARRHRIGVGLVNSSDEQQAFLSSDELADAELPDGDDLTRFDSFHTLTSPQDSSNSFIRFEADYAEQLTTEVYAIPTPEYTPVRHVEDKADSHVIDFSPRGQIAQDLEVSRYPDSAGVHDRVTSWAVVRYGYLQAAARSGLIVVLYGNKNESVPLPQFMDSLDLA
jgi:hypothetical protein